MMRRRFRYSSPPALAANTLSHLFRMGSLLIVLGLIYSWSRNPQTWHWSAEASDASAAPAEIADGTTTPWLAYPAQRETVVPGPNELDKAEAANGRKLFDGVSDRTPLDKVEMPAYWRCMKWARSQSFADLQRRAASVLFMQLVEQPDKYRGQPIKLHLHVVRILNWAAEPNVAGVKRVYEAVGWTDDSKSHPYIVVFSELPPDMKLGDELHEEGIFVGYFLKTMAYTAFDKNRFAPLLIGRMQRLASAAPARPLVRSNEWLWLFAVGVPLAFLGLLGIWLQSRRLKRPPLVNTAAADETEMENWFKSEQASAASDRPAGD